MHSRCHALPHCHELTTDDVEPAAHGLGGILMDSVPDDDAQRPDALVQPRELSGARFDERIWTGSM